MRYFGDKISLNGRQVLFRLFRVKTAQSTTAITSIAIRALHESSKKIKQKILIKSFCYFWLLQKVESLLSCHCEKMSVANFRGNPKSDPKNPIRIFKSKFIRLMALIFAVLVRFIIFKSLV